MEKKTTTVLRNGLVTGLVAAFVLGLFWPRSYIAIEIAAGCVGIAVVAVVFLHYNRWRFGIRPLLYLVAICGLFFAWLARPPNAEYNWWRVRAGMTKSEVVSLVGPPGWSVDSGDSMTYHYMVNHVPYAIQFRDGTVVAIIERPPLGEL
jgi:hypothetical protein